jgi:hypothetical protein
MTAYALRLAADQYRLIALWCRACGMSIAAREATLEADRLTAAAERMEQ